MKSPIALLLSLLLDCKRLNPGVKGLERDSVTLEKRFENEGLGFLTKALPAYADALLLGLSTRQFTCPVGFKRSKGRAIPKLFSGMLCEVFDPFTGILVESPDIGVLKCLYGILKFYKKAQVSAEDEDVLHQKAVNEFYQCDESASRVVIPDRHDHHIGRVCKIILNSLNSKEIENGIYKHGPGAVYEGYRANQKWYALHDAVWRDGNILHEFGLWGPGGNPVYSRKLDSSPTPGKESEVAFCARLEGLKSPTARLPRRENGSSKKSRRSSLSAIDRRLLKESPYVFGASRSSARLISVAKNSTSRRTITVEPMLNQFVQQGLNTLLRDSISECKVLGNCIALSNQSLNQKLALEGSHYDNWATIDLKSASDLLSLRLVKSVFRHNAQFLERMMECRSPSVECANKDTLNLGKFAGMGNALTFPVQSICFAVVCLAAILDQDGVAPSYWNLRRASRHIRVYGDDIIVTKRYAHQCVAWLQEVGLKINLKKSFLEGNFKESCGVDAWRGVDITPHYLKHHPDSSATSPNVLAGFVALSNHMWLDGLYSASTWLQEFVEKAIGSQLPLVSRDSGSFGWVSRTDAMTPHKWCRRTHKFLTRTYALKSVRIRDELDGYPALWKCLMKLAARNRENPDNEQEEYIKSIKSLIPKPMAEDPDHLQSTVMRYTYRMCRRWVPTQVWDGLNLAL